MVVLPEPRAPDERTIAPNEVHQQSQSIGASGAEKPTARPDQTCATGKHSIDYVATTPLASIRCPLRTQNISALE
jgi:hypothetical protein